MFFDPQQFAFTAPLEAAWPTIYQEYLGIRDQVIDWIEPELYEEGWKVYGLFDFPHGKALTDNIRQCPVTASLVQRHIPPHRAAGFSILRPGTRIKPHQGYAGNFLRCHLALSVPAGDCALKVDQETRIWHEGKVLVFDDRLEHSAWNLSEKERVVLLIDFIADHSGLRA